MGFTGGIVRACGDGTGRSPGAGGGSAIAGVLARDAMRRLGAGQVGGVETELADRLGCRRWLVGRFLGGGLHG